MASPTRRLPHGEVAQAFSGSGRCSPSLRANAVVENTAWHCEHVCFFSHEQNASEWETGFHG